MSNRYPTEEAATAALQEGQIVVHTPSYVVDKWTVFTLPKVGDVVSRGFNGDYYPSGKIARISKTMKKITTDTGVVFWRKGDMNWSDGCFWMVEGNIERQNPHL